MRARSRGLVTVLGLTTTALVIVAAGLWLAGAVAARVREITAGTLSSALGRPILIGRVSGDPWRGVTLEDISLAPARAGEPSALSARRLVAYVDLGKVVRDLVARHGLAASVTRNISQIVLDEPVVRLTRSVTGAWDVVQALSSPSAGASPAAFRGRLIVLDGRAMLIDRYRIAPRTFEAHVADLNGTIDFARTPRIALRAAFTEERRGRSIAARVAGAYQLDRGLLDIDVQAYGLDAAAWGPYLLTTPTFRIAGGQVDARVHVLRTRAGRRAFTDVSGRLTIHEGRASFPGRPADLAGIHGDIEISNRAISTERLRGVFNGARVEVRGEASFYGEPRINVAARTRAADLTRLGRLFFPGLVSRLSGVVGGEVWITGPISAPRLEGRIHAARGHLDRQPFERASADIALYGGLFGLLDARFTSGGGRLDGTGIWTLGAPQFFLALRADGVAASAVRPWTPEALPPFDGRVRGTLTVARQGLGLALAGQAALLGGVVHGVVVDDLDTSFHVNAGTVAIEHLRVRKDTSLASVWGTVSSGGALALHAQGSTANLASAPLVRVPGSPTGLVDFAGRLGGTLTAPALAGDILIRDARIGEFAFDSVAGRIAVRDEHVELAGVQARAGHAFYRAMGTVGWGPAPRLSLDLQADRAPAASLLTLTGNGVPVTGVVDGRIRIDGPLPQPAAAGMLVVRDAELYGQKIDAASAAFRWDGRRLVLEGASLRRRESTLHVAGTFDRREGLGLDIFARGLDVHDIVVPQIGPTRIDGRLELTGRITGPLVSPVLAVESSSADLTINGLKFDRATGALRWANQTLRLDPLALRVGGEQYDLIGEVGLAGPPRISLTATVSGGRLSTLLGLVETRLGVPLDGTINGVATLEGPVASPAARLELSIPSGQFGTHRLSGHADLALRDASVTIQDLELRFGEGRVAATGRYDLGGESQIEVSGAGLDLDVLRPLFRLRRPLVGRLDFTLQLGGTLAAPDLGLDLEVSKGGIGGSTFDSLVVSAFHRDGLLQLVQGLLVQNGHKVRASGSVPFNPKSLRFDSQAPLDFRLTLADTNLGLLRLLTDRIEDAKGALDGTITVGGTVAVPRLGGGVRVADGSLRVRGLRTPIESLNLDLRLDETTLRVERATAQVGGGTARLDGAARLHLAASGSAALEIPPESPVILQTHNVRLDAPPLVHAQFDASVRLWGTTNDPRRPLTLGGRIVASAGTVVATAGGGGTVGVLPLAFQGLQLVAGRDLAVEAGSLRFPLKPDGLLTLGGTWGALQIDGVLEAQRSAVRVLGSTFDLEEGSATFRPALGVRPQISALAVSHVAGTRITLEVNGIAPDALTLDLRSDPSLAQSEILALLGRQAGLSDLLTGNVAGLLRAEITRRLVAPVTLAIGQALGLSELTLVYDFERPLRLTVGKLLLPDLYITLTTAFEERARWLWALEYRFAPGWRFAFRVDQDGQPTAIFWYATRF